MSRGKLKGITIQLDAETTGLSKALEGVNRQAREAQGELRQVDRLLKFDPKNTELLAQKQSVVAKRIEATKDKLVTLRQAQAQVEKQFKDGDIGEEAYREFQREIVKTEQELIKLEAIGRRSAATLAASLDAAGTRIKKVGDNIASAGRSMTMGVTLPLTAIGVTAVRTAAEFEQTMNMVRVNSKATGREFVELSDLALKMGADTVFSANESAQAMLELSKGGLKPADIQAGALAATMNLAATEGLALDSAATIVVRTMKTFNLSAEDTNKVVDALAAGAISSTAGVTDMADAFKYVGSTAAQNKVPLVDVATGIAMVTDAGIDGTTAGTSYNRFLLGLAGTTKKGAKVIEEYGLRFYDANGQMRPTIEIVGELERAFGGLNEQQKTAVLKDLFGVEGMRAANILLARGVEGYQAYRSEVEQTGRAQEMAEARMAGVMGALEQAAGSLETAANAAGDIVAPQVIRAAGAVKDLADGFTELPETTQKTIITMAELLAIVGPTVWVFGSLAGAAGNVAKAGGWVIGVATKTVIPLTNSGSAAAGASVGYGKLAASTGAATAGLKGVEATAPVAGAAAAGAGGTIAASGRAAQAGWAGLLGPIMIAVTAIGMVKTAAEGFIEWAATKFFIPGLSDIAGKTADIRTQYYLATTAGEGAAKSNQKVGDTSSEATPKIGGLESAVEGYADAAGEAATETSTLIRGLDGLETESDGVEGNMRTAADAMRAYRESLLASKDATERVTELEKEGKKGTEEWTRAVLDAEEANQRMKDSRGENLDAMHDLNVALVTGSSKTKNLTGDQIKLIDELDTASARVAKLKGKLDTVPKSKRSKIEAEIEQAEKDLERIKAKIAGVKGKTITVRVTFAGSGNIKRAVVDGKLTGWVVNRMGGVYDQPTAALIGETYEREWVINGDLLARGDRRQRALVSSLLEYAARGQRAAMPAAGGGDTLQIINNGLADMEGAVTIATKRALVQAQPIGRYLDVTP